MTGLLFPLLKAIDAVTRPKASALVTTTVHFEHPDAPHLMKELYSRKKEAGSLFRIEADDATGIWRERIKLGGMTLENRYRLEATDHEWRGTPTWQTWTSAKVSAFEIDFRDPKVTVLRLHGDPAVTESPYFLDWFDYVRGAGITNIRCASSAPVGS